MQKQTKGIIYLLLSALTYSTMPVLIRILGSDGMPPMAQVFLRYVFAFLTSSVYLFFLSKNKLKVERKDLLLLGLATIFCYSLTNLFFTYGILYTAVSNALFIFYSYAIFTPMIGFFILKDKLNKYNSIAIGLSILALYLLFSPTSLPTWKLGGLFALLAALGQSIYVVIRRLLSKYPAVVMMFLNTLVGVIVLGSLSLFVDNKFYFHGGIGHLKTISWIITVIFGLLNFFGWFFMTKGFELFNATSGSMILLTELLFGIIFALLFFAEVPTMFTLLGGFLILGASVLVITKGQN